MDDFDIKTLPADFISVSRPTKRIEELVRRNENKHQDTILCMYSQIKEVNVEIDQELREEINRYKFMLNSEGGKIQIILSSFQELTPEKVLKGFNFKEIIQSFEDVNKHRAEVIKDFHEMFEVKEKKRSEMNKAILKQTYEILEQLSCLTTFELEEFFEKEILNINEITVTNYKTFAELENNLNMQIMNDSKIWKQKIDEIKDRLKKVLVEMAAKHENGFPEMLQTHLKEFRSSELQDEIKRFKSKRGSLIEVAQQIDLPVSKEQVEKWLIEMQTNLASLDTSAKNIMDLYKSIIIIIFNRFFDELEILKSTISETDVIPDKDQLENVQIEMYTPAIEDLNIQLQSELEHNNKVWRKYIDSMTRDITETYEFLKGAAHLWDAHFERETQLKGLVLLDLQNTIFENFADEEQYEAQMNVIIDKLRQSPSIEVLENLYEQVKRLLDRMEKEIYTYTENEQNILHKYEMFMDMESDVLKTEIGTFLLLHPPDEEKDPKKQRRRASKVKATELPAEEDVVPIQLLFGSFQVDAVKNWMFGLWEAIQHYNDNCKEEVQKHVEEWKNIQLEKLDVKLSLRLMFHRPRYDRIKYSIYEKRLAELKKHARRLTGHEMAAKEELDKMKEVHNTQLAIIQDTVGTKYLNKLTSIFEQSKMSWRSKHITRYRHEIHVVAEDYKKETDQLLKNYSDLWEDHLQTLRISNYLFLKSIRFFHQNANYTLDEFKIVEKTLDKLLDTSFKEKNNLQGKFEEKIRYFRNLIVDKQSHILPKLHEIVEEHEFIETSEGIIKQAREDTMNEMNALKKLSQQMKNNFKQFFKKYSVCSEGIDYKNMIEEMNKMFSDMQTVQNDLKFFHYEDVPLNERQQQQLHESSSLLKTKKTHVHAPPKTPTTTTGKDKTPSESAKTLKNVSELWVYAFSYLKKLADTFYSKRQVLLLDSSKLQPTILNFLEECLGLKVKFKDQIQDFWLQQNLETLEALKEYSLQWQTFLTDLENTFYSRSLENFEKVYKSIMSELDETRKNVQEELDKFYQKLKVVYGHVNNSKLLKELRENFEKFVDEKEKEISKSHPYREQIIATRNKIKQELEQLMKCLKVLHDDNRLEKTIRELEAQLNPKEQVFVKFEHESVKKDASKSDVNPARTSSKLTTKSEEKTQIQNHSSTSFSSENLQKFVEKLHSYHTECLENIERSGKNTSSQLNQFKEIWMSELKIILSLFKLSTDSA